MNSITCVYTFIFIIVIIIVFIIVILDHIKPYACY